MVKLNYLRKAWGIGKHFVKKNAPTLMAVGAMVGVGVTVGLAIKETPKAIEKVEEKKKIDPNLSKFEVIAVAGPEFAAALMALIITEGLIFGSNHLNLKRIAPLGALCSLLAKDNKTKDEALEKLKKALEEFVGEEKAKEIKKELGLEPKPAYDTEKSLYEPLDSERLYFGKHEIRPCVLHNTGQIFRNSIAGLEWGLNKYREDIESVDGDGFAPFSDLQYNIKCGQCGLSNICGYNRDSGFSWTIEYGNVEGSPGYIITLTPNPEYSYDYPTDF